MLCINKNVLENTNYNKYYDVNNNSFFVKNSSVSVDIKKLWDEFEKTSDKHYNINLDIDDINNNELKLFHDIFIDILFYNDNFCNYYMEEIDKKFLNKQNHFKINIDNIIDKYLTNEIKKNDNNIYQKYMAEKTVYGYINHIKILLFIDKLFYPSNNTAFLVLYLTFKEGIKDINYLSYLYKGN